MLKITSRKEAKLKGLTDYFTGKKCKHGHISNRRVDNGGCSECKSIYTQGYYKDNKKEYLQKKKRYREKFPNIVKQTRKKSRDKHKEKNVIKTKEYYASNPGLKKLANQKYKQKHPKGYKLSKKKYFQKKQEDPIFRINNAISNYLWRSLKNNKNKEHWEEFVEFSIKDLVKHLKKKLKKGMTMKNYGTYWHIDHKIPKAYFNITSADDPDFKRLWALENLRPLKAIDNLKKSSIYEGIKYSKNISKKTTS